MERAELAEDESLRDFEGGRDDGPFRLLLPALAGMAACVARGVAVSSDDMDTAEEDDCEIWVKPEGEKRFPRIVGTTVCVEVVDREEDEDEEEEGAGE